MNSHGAPNTLAMTAHAKTTQGDKQHRLTIEVKPGHDVVLPHGVTVTDADFVRHGPDLVLVEPDGSTVLIKDYFAADSATDLLSADGAFIPGDLAARLAGSIAPGQFAQVGTGSGAQAIGRADTLTGDVTVVHADGTKNVIHKGDAVFQGDVLQTPKGASVGLVFMDGTTLGLGSNGRMVLDKMVYDADTHSGKSAFSLIQGTFSFVSGQIAKSSPDAALIRTPVATIGIRGTMVAGSFTQDTGLTTTLLPESQSTGEFTITTASGTTTNNMSFGAVHVSNFFAVPSAVVQVNHKQVANSFQEVLSTVSSSETNQAAKESAQQILSQTSQQAGGEQQQTQQTNTTQVAGGAASQRPQGTGQSSDGGQTQAGAPSTVESAFTAGDAHGAPQSSSATNLDAKFAAAAQAAILSAVDQGKSIESALQAALVASQVYGVAKSQGASSEQAMSAAGAAAQQSGVLTSTPFTNIPTTSNQNGATNVSTNTSNTANASQANSVDTTVHVTMNSSSNSSTSAASLVTPTTTTSASTNAVTSSVTSTDTSSTNNTNSVVNGTTTSDTSTSTATAATAYSYSGRAIDGYVSGATVFLDSNGNKSLDSGEVWTTTDSLGNFTLPSTTQTGTLVITGGTDISTGKAFTGLMTAPSGSSVVTPLTTIMASMMAANPAMTSAQVMSNLALSLGITTVPDLTSYDPVAVASGVSSGNTTQAAQVLAAAIKVQCIVAQISALINGAASSVSSEQAASEAFKAIANLTAGGSALATDSTSMSTLIGNVATAVGQGGNPTVTNAAGSVAAMISNIATQITTTAGSTTNATYDLAKLALVAANAVSDISTNVGSPSTLATMSSGTYGSGIAATISQAANMLPQSSGATATTSSVVGTSGVDTLHAITGTVLVQGLDGNDMLTGSIATGSPVTLEGGLGDDKLVAGVAGDWLYGQGGNDILRGGGGNDHIDGGLDNDTLTYAGNSTPVTITLATSTVTGTGSGTDVYTNIETIVGSDANDTIVAASLSDISSVFVDAGAGTDTLQLNTSGVGYQLSQIASHFTNLENISLASDVGLTIDTSNTGNLGAVSLTEQGGNIQVDQNVTVGGLSLTGGNQSGTGTITDSGSFTWASGAVIGGNVVVTGTTAASVTSSVTLNGTLTLNNTLNFSKSGGIGHIYGSGTLILNGAFNNNYSNSRIDTNVISHGVWTVNFVDLQIGGLLTNTGTINFVGAQNKFNGGLVNSGTIQVGTASYASNLTISGTCTNVGGAINVSGGKDLYFTNSTADLTGGALNLSGRMTATNSTVTLPGTFSTGSMITLNNSTLIADGTVNLGSATLVNNGTVKVNGGTLTIANNYTNGGSIVLDNGDSAMTSSTVSMSSGQLTNTGTITFANTLGTAHQLTLDAQLANSGTVNVNANATVGVSSSAHSNSGTIDIASGTTLSVTGTSLSNTGLLKGTGLLSLGTAAFTNDGTINAAGAGAIGTLTVSGDVADGANAVLAIDIDASSNDTLAISSGAIHLDGALQMDFASGVSVTDGKTYTVLTGTHTGSFASLTDNVSGDIWDVSVSNASSVTAKAYMGSLSITTADLISGEHDYFGDVGTTLSLGSAANLTDADFTHIHGVSTLQLGDTLQLAQSLVLGSNASLSGITTIDASAVTAGLSVDGSADDHGITLLAGSGNNAFTGGSGNDCFVVSGLGGIIDGGSGFDSFILDDAAGFFSGTSETPKLADLTQGLGHLDSIEKIILDSSIHDATLKIDFSTLQGLHSSDYSMNVQTVTIIGDVGIGNQVQFATDPNDVGSWGTGTNLGNGYTVYQHVDTNSAVDLAVMIDNQHLSVV
jgi:hypothetical protein